MRTPGYSEAVHREAAERFVGFAQCERARPILQKWGPWLKTSEGRKAWGQLLWLADDMLSGLILIPQYDSTLVLLSANWAIPQEELEIIARCALEFCRCCYFGVGQVPTADIAPYQAGVANDATI